MKHVRSTLFAVAAFAGAAIPGGIIHAQESARVAQAGGGCVITVQYKDQEGQTRTKTTCVRGGESQCNTLQNNFCAPANANQPDIVSRTCRVVPSCPDAPR